MSESLNDEEEASAPKEMPLASALRRGPPPRKRLRPNEDSENESENEDSSTTDPGETQENANPTDQEAAVDGAEPAAQDEGQPAVQNTIIYLRQQLLNPLLEEERFDASAVFGRPHKLSYEVGSPWKEHTGKVLETQPATLKDD